MEQALLKDVLEIMLEEVKEKNTEGRKGTAIQAKIWVDLGNKNHSGPVMVQFKSRISEDTYAGNEKAKVAIFSDAYEVVQYDLAEPDQNKDNNYYYEVYNMLIRKIR